jgi:hypothetical protein
MSRTALRPGHAPGHVRETFGAAVEAFLAWTSGPEPTVVQVDHEATQIPISHACTLVWDCTAVIPNRLWFGLTEGAGLDVKTRTYAACARAMHATIKQRQR